MNSYEHAVAEAANEATTWQTSFGRKILGSLATYLWKRTYDIACKPLVWGTASAVILAGAGVGLYYIGDRVVKLHDTINSTTTFPGMPGVPEAVPHGGPQSFPTEAGVPTISPEVAVN